jgi:hypothetical protein
VAKSLPDIRFIFYGGGDADPTATGNCEFRGWVKPQEITRDSNCVLRLTIHDGLPMNVVEFLLQGRDAICTVPGLEGAYYAGRGDFGSDAWEDKLKQLIKLIRHIQKHPRTLKQRVEASDYWRKEVDPIRCKRKLARYLKEAGGEYARKVKLFKKQQEKKKEK